MLKPEVEFDPDAITSDIIFRLLCKREQPGRDVNGPRIIELVRELGEHGVFPSTLSLTQSITKLCKSEKSNDAWEVLHRCDEVRGVVEAASCNALLTVLGKQRDFARSNELLEKMKEMDTQPNVVTFGIIINHLCKSRSIDVEPDVIIFNTLIDGLCKVGRQDEGLELMKQMKTREDCAPNTVTYLIDGYCKVGELDKEVELFNQMSQQEVPSSVVTLNTLVDGKCKHGRINSAMRFFEKMQSQDLKGDAVTYTSLISAFCGVNNIKKAMKFFQEMLNSGCFADAKVYYSLISALSPAGRMDDAGFVVLKLKEAGYDLDVGCYNVLISGFCKNKGDELNKILKDMEAAGVKPDSITYNTLILYSNKSGKYGITLQLIKKMIKNGIVPTVTTYGTMINAYCLDGNVSEAMKLYREMSSASRVPLNTVITF